MSLKNAIERALRVAKERNEPIIYWSVDLHGVVLNSTYSLNSHQFINSQAIQGLKMISDHPDYRLIIWSSCHVHEHQAIKDFLANHDIQVDYFNSNPEVANTHSGCFDHKFYFSILLDDKAGFDPEEDWEVVIKCLQ